MLARHPPAALRQFAFMLVEQFSMIAFVAAVEPLRLANRVLGEDFYGYRLHSASGAAAVASNGIEVRTHGRFADARDADAMIVCAGIDVNRPDHEALKAALRRAAAGGSTIGALCTGTYVLAEAGLLDGYRATVHWENLPGLLAEHPDADLALDLFEIDRTRMTCAGGTAAADMMLAVIARQHGETIAAAVAEQLIHHRIRDHGERQRMDPRVRLGVANARILRAVALMSENLSAPLGPERLAAAAGISPRQLERLFGAHLGTTPARYYLDLRLQRARTLVRQTALPLIDVAVESGFSSPSHFSRAYHARFGASPSTERRGRSERLALP